MSATINVKVSDKKLEQDGLRINKRRGLVHARLRAFRFLDNDTKQFVIYIPSLEMSAYGNTEKEADEMIRFSIDELMKNLIKLPLDKINAELLSLGWKRNAFHNKEFSNAYVDGDGVLQGMNVGSKIEELTLVA